MPDRPDLGNLLTRQHCCLVQVAEYKDGAWGGIAGPSRAALAEENEVLRSHLANLGWTQKMMETTVVRTTVPEDVSALSARHSSSAQVMYPGTQKHQQRTSEAHAQVLLDVLV